MARPPKTQPDSELISAEEVNSISDLRNAYETAYIAYINLNTHNAITAHLMKVADDNAYAVILPLRQRLKNGTAELTPTDYANLGIHEDKTTRTPSTIPIKVPMAILIDSQPLNLTFEATEHTSESVHRAVLPRNHRVAREIAVIAAENEPSERNFHSISTTRHSRFTIVFTAAEVGMNMYIRLAYENNAGRGPFSLPVKAIII